jgi:hypothetical protein
MGQKKMVAGYGHEGIADANWDDSVLLSEVISYLREKTKEIARAFEYLQTWDPYLHGYESGMLAGLKIAEDVLQCMSDRVMASEKPWPSEPYPLDGLDTVL